MLLGRRQHDDVGRRLPVRAPVSPLISNTMAVVFPESVSPSINGVITILLWVLVRIWNKLLYLKCLAECLAQGKHVNVFLVSQI